MERWERNIMNAVGDPDDSADSYSSNDAGGYSTNPFVRLAAQLAGGGAAAIGGQLSYLGSLINGAHDYEDEPSIDQVLRQAGVGNFLLNNGEYLQNVGEDWNAHYKNHAWDGMSLGDRLTNPGYWYDSGGMMADVANGLGSSIPFMAETAVLPEVSLPARGVGLLASVLGKVGAKRVASAIDSKVLKGVVDEAGNPVTKPSWLMGVANDVGNYALKMAPMEAASNAGGIYSDLKEQGLSDSEILGKMNDMIKEELPLDMVTSGVFGATLGGKTFSRLGQGGFKRALAANALNVPMEMASEGIQEMAQQRVQNKYSGKPYGTWFNPTEDELEAGRLAAIGALPTAMWGVRGGVRNSRAMAREAANEAEREQKIQQMQNDADSIRAIAKDMSVPTADGRDVTEMDPQEAIDWFNQQTQQYNIEAPSVNMPQVNTQQAQTNSNGSMPTYSDKAYTITSEVSNPNLVGGTEQKLNALAHAYKDKFGENLQVTSMRREGNPNDSWHNSGQAFDVSGGGVSSNQNGEREFLIQKGQELGLVPLDEYAHPSPHATGGHIHFSDHEGGEAKQSAQNNAGNAEAAMGGTLTKSSGNQQYDAWIEQAAAKNGVPANLISALLDVESGYNPNAKSPAGAVGIAQFMPSTAESFGIDPYNPQQAIDGAARYLKQEYDHFGNWSQALEAYNGGRGNVGSGETKAYAQKVLGEAGDISNVPKQTSSQQNVSLQNFANMLSNKLLDFADTNDEQVKKIFDDLGQVQKDEAMSRLFAPNIFTDENGKPIFRNTAEIRAAMASNEAFQQFARRYVEDNLSQYVPKEIMDAGSMTLDQAKDLLSLRAPKARAQGKAPKKVQVNVQATPQATQRTAQGTPTPQVTGTLSTADIPAFVSFVNNASHTPEDISFVQGMLDSNGRFHNTPENQSKVQQYFKGSPIVTQFLQMQQTGAQTGQQTNAQAQPASQVNTQVANTFRVDDIPAFVENMAQTANTRSDVNFLTGVLDKTGHFIDTPENRLAAVAHFGSPAISKFSQAMQAQQEAPADVNSDIPVPETAQGQEEPAKHEEALPKASEQQSQPIEPVAPQNAQEPVQAAPNAPQVQTNAPTPKGQQTGAQEVKPYEAPQEPKAAPVKQQAEKPMQVPQEDAAREQQAIANKAQQVADAQAKANPIFETSEYTPKTGKNKGQQMYAAKIVRKLKEGEPTVADLKKKATAHNGTWNKRLGGFNFHNEDDRAAFLNEADNGGRGQSAPNRDDTLEALEKPADSTRHTDNASSAGLKGSPQQGQQVGATGADEPSPTSSVSHEEETTNGREQNLFDGSMGTGSDRENGSKPVTGRQEKVSEAGGERAQAGKSENLRLDGRGGESDAAVKPDEQPEKQSVFGSKEDAMSDLEAAFGLKRVDKTPQGDFKKAIDTNNKLFEEAKVSEKEQLEKEIADLSKQLQDELKKVNANPMFNPKIYTLGAQIGVKLVRLGFKKFEPWAAHLLKVVGDDIKPWVQSIWKGINNAPTDREFNAKGYAAAVRYCGTLHENGVTDFNAIAKEFTNTYGKEAYQNIEGYLRAADAAINEYMHPTNMEELTKGETKNADDSTGKLAERAGEGDDQNRVGQTDAGRGPRTGNEQEGVQQAGAKSGPRGGAGVRDRGTSAGGETGHRGVQKEESENRTGSAGGPELSGGVRAGYDGSARIDDGRKAADITSAQDRQVHAAAEKVKAAKPAKQNSGKFKAGDLDQIKNDLPCLQDAQAEDVKFGEDRLFGEKGGEGVLFTNGTGTGKTFTGLGLVKRMINSGRKNILIISPTAEINKSWVNTAKKFFGVDIHVLESTTDAGREGQVCVTTYANFQQNAALVKDRNWDAVIADESHNILNNASGTETGILKMLRAVTAHARGLGRRLELKYRTKKMEALVDKIRQAQMQRKVLVKAKNKDALNSLDEHIRDFEADYYTELNKLRKAHADVLEKWEKMPQQEKPRVVFLSATPFAYDKDVDYGEGYLWNYESDKGKFAGYNQGNGRDKFMMQHFGYRMRYNKLTRPDGKVDNRAMEVQFHDDMAKAGVIRGRQLEVDKDYDRGFILVGQGIGKTIDEGFEILRNDKHYSNLYEALRKRFDRRAQRYLLESIKAGEAVKLARQYVKMGRKVVIFHQSMVEHDNVRPFDIKGAHLTQEEYNKALPEYRRFAAEHPELVNINLGTQPSPMETFAKAFGDDALYIDGSAEHKKSRKTAVEQFNDDNSGKNIIIVQQDAGNAGISLHDTTGKHQRVLINIAMPERPSYAMQIEGRIYRVGNQSNAVFRYLATGTNMEKQLFASTIGGRAETVENLALGNKARGLRDSFTNLYLETLSDDWKRRLPGAEGEGTGGKEMDETVGGDLSDWDRAKAFYFARGKKTSSNKSAEGNDYYATPEPIGMKMVQWLGQKIGDRFLEPSAGHGAISRWSSDNAINTVVEPSGKLAPEAQMVTPNAKLFDGDFMEFDIHNKFEGIAMNPPFGHGGKTAIEHVAKAYKHLADGGRMIAIIPDGPSCEAHFNKWFYGENKQGEPIKGAKPPMDAVLVASVRMPGVMFERAGTTVHTKILVIDKYADKGDREKAEANARGEADFSNVKDINELFDLMENYSMPPRIGADRVQNFTTEKNNRASKAFEAHTDSERIAKSLPIIKAARFNGGYYDNRRECFVFDTADARKKFMDEANRYVDEHKDQFAVQDTSETREAGSTQIKQDAAQTETQAEPQDKNVQANANEHIQTSTFTRTDNGEEMPAAKIAYNVDRDAYKAIRDIAKANHGYWSRVAKQFLFHTTEGRDAFAKAAAAYLQEHHAKKYSIVYHGTQHVFDQFDAGYVGTGEGLASHGWGMYFAKDKDVSQNYRERLIHGATVGNDNVIFIGDKAYTYYGQSDIVDNATGEQVKSRPLRALIDLAFRKGKDLGKVRAFLERVRAKASPNGMDIKMANGGLDVLNNQEIAFDKEREAGMLAEAKIPDENVMLDEQASVADQPPKVREALAKLGISPDSKLEGGIIYRRLTRKYGSAKEASMALNEVGIKGIKYDGKADGECYVVFDDKAISLLRKLSIGKAQREITRSAAELKHEIMLAFPHARNVRDDGDHIAFTMPNGLHVEVSLHDDMELTGREAARARADHGYAPDVAIKVNGSEYVINGQAIIDLSKRGEVGTAYHEAMHVAMQMVLNPTERRALFRKYGTEEKIADAYRDYMEKHAVGKYHAFGKLMGKIRDFFERLASHLPVIGEAIDANLYARQVFEDLASGKKWGYNEQERPSRGFSLFSRAEAAGKGVDNGESKGDNEDSWIDDFYAKRIPQKHREYLADKVKSYIGEHLEDITAYSAETIRDEMPLLSSLRATFHNEGYLANDKFDKGVEELKDILALSHEYARRCFDNDERVKARIDVQNASIGRPQGIRGGAEKAVSARTRRKYSEGSNGRNKALHPATNNEVRIIRDRFESIRDKAYSEEDHVHHSISRSDNQDGFSSAEKHFSVSEEKTEKRGRSFVKKAADKLAKGWHLKGDKIMIEEDDKPSSGIGFFDHIWSPSRIASKVPRFRVLYQMGVRAQQKVVDLRNDFDRKMNGVYKLVKDKDDKADLFDLLLRGDAESKEWSTQELHDMGYNDNVAEAYKRVRRLMNKAYHMVNEARRGGVPKSATVTQAELDELRNNKFVKMQAVTDKGYQNGQHNYTVSYIAYRCYPRGYKHCTADMIQRFEQDGGIQIMNTRLSKDINGNVVRDADGNPLQDVEVLEGPADMSKLKGYIPHFFHDYFIRVVDKNGDYRLIGSGRNQREAVMQAEEWKKHNELADGETIHIVPKTFDFNSLGMSDTYYAPVMGDMDYYSLQRNLSQHNDMSLDEAKDMLSGNVRLKGRHRFFGNALHRTGAEGYETDLGWVLNHYFHSASRYVAMETEFKPKAISYFERMYGRFDDDHEGNAEARYAKDYVNDLNGNPSTLEQSITDLLMHRIPYLSKLFRNVVVPTYGERAALTFGNGVSRKISYLTLGLNMSSALLNFTQLVNAAAYLGSVRSLATMVAKGRHHKYSIAELRVLREAGVFADIGLDSGSGYDQMRRYSPTVSRSRLGSIFNTANTTMDWLGNKSMFFFQEADAICRRGTVLAAYEKARKEGKSHREAIAYAQEINRKANFDYGVADAPNIFRRGSIISQLTLQFKKFGIKELEVMGDFLGKSTSAKQKAMFWGMYFLLAGAMGIPALDWLDDFLGERSGFYSKDELQKIILKVTGGNKLLAVVAMYGAPALANINMSNRAGLSDVIPTSIGDFAGAALSKTGRLIQDLSGGNYASALRDVSPGLYNLYAAGSGESYGKRDRLNDRYVTAWDRILRAVGFRSVDESAPVDMQRIISHEKTQASKEKQEAQDAYIKNPSGENAAKLKALGVDPKAVKKEQSKKGMTREQRMEQTVPKKDRANYQRYIDFAKE